MSETQLIIISKDNIEESIKETITSGVEHHYALKINCPLIKERVKHTWKEIRRSPPETYIFLGQYPNAFIYGLYKTEKNRIYIVKSFMDTVINVVLFNKKYFE